MTYVVIGANYGDEGKGLMTDFITRQEKCGTVVRFNGGAQAGHTVVLPTGQSHVFSHIGSGFFAGAKTLLGKRFIVNPLILEREIEKLRTPTWPRIDVHPEAQVSTIYDMLINAAIEKARGSGKHGSCGLGINETVTRSLARPDMSLTFNEVKAWSVNDLAMVLEHIAREWVPGRVHALGLDDIADDITTPMGIVYKTANYKAHAKAMLGGLAHLGIMEGYGEETTTDTYTKRNIVFEGAQGLALDELMGDFPHVTRSLTGLPYAIEAAAELGLKKLTPLYATRSYVTRHGAGPLPCEGMTITSSDITDLTNVTNEWQDTIRFAPLHLGELRQRIVNDLERSKTVALMHGITIEEPELAVTCIDQLGSNVRVIRCDGTMASVPRADLVHEIQQQTNVTIRYTSHGPTAENVVRHDRIGV